MSTLVATPVSSPPPPTGVLRSLSWHALGTRCEVRYVSPFARPSDTEQFEQSVRGWVERFETRYSRFRPTSLVSQINTTAGSGTWVAIDAEMEEMLDICGTLHAMTGGILDATAGPLLRLWNYKEPPVQLPDAATIEAARQLVGWSLVERRRGQVRLPRPGMTLDFGGWGKEWAVDTIAGMAATHGVTQVMVDFGHDIRCLGTPPGRPAWHIGLEDPSRPGAHSGSIAVYAGHGVASSGDYLRCFMREGRRYGHIVDPRTGRPVSHGLQQVTVIAGGCFQAGVLATTAFVLGEAAGLEFIRRFPEAEALFVHPRARAQTRGFWRHVVS